MKKKNIIRIALAISTVSLVPLLHAAEISKANNTSNLTLNASWVGAVVPSSSDVAVWGSTINASNSSGLGGNLSVAGLKFTNPGGTLMTITGNRTLGHTLTIGSAGIDMSSSLVDVSFTTPIFNFSDSQTWNIASGRTLQFGNTGAGNQDGTASSNVTITMTGGGGVVLGYSGNATVQPFGSAQLSLDNIRIRSGSAGRFINNNISLDGNIGIGATTLDGLITITRNISVGNATRTISLQSLTTNGSFTALTLSGNGTVAGSGVLAFENGNASGTLRINLSGTGATNTIESDIKIGERVQAFFNRTVLTNLTDLTVDGEMSMSNLSSASIAQTVRSLSGNATGVVNATQASGVNNAVLTIDGGISTDTFTFSGNVVDSTTAFGRLALTKSGSTTQVLNGTNTFSGNTTINGGILVFNGSKSNGSNSSLSNYGNVTLGNILVNSGATLAGNATISGNSSANNSNLIRVNSGGTLAPGNLAIGTMTIDGALMTGTTNVRTLNLAANATLSLELAADGSSADRIDLWNFVSGDVLFGGTNAVNLSLIGSLVGGTHTVDIFRFYSDSGTTLTTSGFTSSNLTVGTLGEGIESANLIYDSVGGLIQLQYTVIPEPSTWVLIVFTLITIAALRSRRLIARRQN